MFGIRGSGKCGGKGYSDKGRSGRYGEDEVNLSGQGLDDAQIEGWCERWKGNAKLLSALNLSNNSLGDAAGTRLTELLLELEAPLKTLKLFSNRLGDDAAVSLAKYVQGSKHVLAELHLSHNVLTWDGAVALLTAAVAAASEAGGPRYPSFDTVCTARRPVPFWLRLEYNIIDFNGDMETVLAQVRRERGYLSSATGLSPPMLCEAPPGCYCNPRSCALLCPGGLDGAPGGPVVHVPFLKKQRNSRSPPLPRARSPVHKPVHSPAPAHEQVHGRRPCVDFRLSAAAKVGEVRRVARTVTAADATAAGNAPDNFLHPLEPDEEVAVLYVDGGWLWAKRVAGEESGWLALDATASA